MWLGFSVKFDLEKKKLNELNFYKFKEKPKKIKSDDFVKTTTRKTKKSKLIDKSEIKVEIAINNYGFLRREDEYTSESKAREFVWQFEHQLEEYFFELLGYEIE